MKKRILAMLLLVCLLIPMISTNAYAASKKILSINWNNISTVGNQAGKDSNRRSSITCSCFSVAYCRTILDGYPHAWYEFNLNNKSPNQSQYSGICASWSDGGYDKVYYSDKKTVLKKARKSIDDGRPVILYVRGPRSSEHYVAVVGYTNAGSDSSLTESNFLVIDPIDGAFKKEPQNLGALGYTLKWASKSNGKSGNGYEYIYTNNGSVKTDGNNNSTVSNTLPTISGSNAPSSLTKGRTYSIKGTISSSTKITSVVAGVYTSQSGGTKMTGSSAKPNRTSYSLANLDPYLYFNKLDPGTYYYRVTATNSAGTVTLINSKFTVTGPITNNTSSYATISGANYPSSLQPGQTYSLTGTISSKTRITSVTAGVYTSNSGSNMVTGKTVRPNSTSYNLKNIDRYVYFNRLNAGTYYYIVKATNSAGTKVLINQKFTVSNSVVWNWCGLAPKCAPRARADVDNAGTKDGTNVQLYAANGTNAQTWRLVDLGNGYYAIQSKLSTTCKCLDVAGGRAVSGTNVQLYSWNQSNAQQWKLVDAGGGYYYICSRLNPNLCLDVSNGSSANGANLQVYTRNNSTHRSGNWFN